MIILSKRNEGIIEKVKKMISASALKDDFSVEAFVMNNKTLVNP